MAPVVTAAVVGAKILAKIVESLYKIMPFAWDDQEWYCQQRDRRKIPSLPVWQNQFYQVCVLKGACWAKDNYHYGCPFQPLSSC